MSTKLRARRRCWGNATELPIQRRVTIWHPVTMPWIVLPRMTIVRMSMIVIVDTVVAPIPRPVKEIDTDADTDAPRESAIPVIAHPWRPVHRRIIRPPPGSVDHRWVVVRHIYDIGIRRRDIDAAVRLVYLDLRVGIQIAGLLRFLAQLLNRLHHLRLLREERITQAFGPLDFLVQRLQYLRKGDQRFDARIPILAIDSLNRRITREIGIGTRPARRLDDLQRIGRRYQNLR